MVTTAPLGIIETLSAGFATVNKRLWLLLLPILLDLLLAFAPGISFTPVVNDTLSFLQARLEGQGGLLNEGVDPSQDNLAQALKQSQEAIGAFRDTNLLGLLAWRIPSIITATSGTPLPKLQSQATAEIGSSWLLLGSAVALALLSLLGVSFYLAAIAQSVRSEVFAAATFLRKTLRGWASFTLFFVGLLLLSLPGSTVLVVLLGAASLFGAALLGLVSGIVMALVLAIAYYLYFVDDAIFITEAWPLQAAWYSATIVWHHFWSALGFILLVNLILTGTALAWGWIIAHPLGLMSAIVGHAYIATGLATAGMIFFRERFIAWGHAYAAGSA